VPLAKVCRAVVSSPHDVASCLLTAVHVVVAALNTETIVVFAAATAAAAAAAAAATRLTCVC
jgi:hypothetical protein